MKDDSSVYQIIYVLGGSLWMDIYIVDWVEFIMTLFNQQEFPQFIVNRASAQHLFDHKHNALLNTLGEI